MTVPNIKKLLTSTVERIEKLEEEKKAINSDITDIYKEAKGNGLIPKQIREMLKLRRIDASEREELEYTRDLYLKALGLISD